MFVFLYVLFIPLAVNMGIGLGNFKNCFSKL